MASPNPKTPNKQNKTLSSVEAAQVEGNKPNYVLVVKVTNEGTNGSTIRGSMYNTITGNGWQTPNKWTSQFYYKRADNGDNEVLAETDELLSTFVTKMREKYPDAGVNWMVLKPLRNSQSLNPDEAVLAALFKPDEQ